jgi:hypothetical protein
MAESSEAANAGSSTGTEPIASFDPILSKLQNHRPPHVRSAAKTTNH